MSDPIEIKVDDSISTINKNNNDLLEDIKDIKISSSSTTPTTGTVSSTNNNNTTINTSLSSISADILDLRISKSILSIEEPFKNVSCYNMNIKVDDPQTRSTTFTNFIVYSVSTVPKINGVINVRRRYNDFLWLRDILLKTYPGYFIPPLPGKRALGLYHDDYILERQDDLNRFINRISNDNILSQSLPLKLFLVRHENSLDEGKKDVENILLISNEKLYSSSIIERFSCIFSEALSKDYPNTINEEMLRLKEFLTNSDKELLIMLQNSRLMRNKFADSNFAIEAYASQLNALSKVEANYPQRPEPSRVDILDNLIQWANNSKDDSRHIAENLVTACRYELQDIQSMIEIINSRDELLAATTKAGSRVDKWRSEKEPLSEKQIKAKEEDVKVYNESKLQLEMVDKVIRNYAIPLTWNYKTDLFRKTMKDFAKIQLENTRKNASNWEAMIQSLE